MRRVTTAVAIIVLTTLGACGGSDDAPATGADTTAAGATEPAAAPAGDDAEPIDLCAVLKPEEIAAIVGGPVTLETGPFDACEFDQDEVRAMSGSLTAVALATLGGGFESYKSGALAGFTDGETVDIGVGDEGFVTTGFIGGENYQAAGAVSSAGMIVTVNIAQGVGLDRAVVVEQVTQLLRLALSKI